MGLGNPGRRYKDTPHNAGFEFVSSFRDLLESKGYSISTWELQKSTNSIICEAQKDEKVEFVLALPQTFMNLSGRAVKKLLEKKKYDLVILSHDDLDILVGKYKIQKGKSPKQHNGILDVEQTVDSKDFLRVRIGIEIEERNISGERYVLKKIDKEGVEKLKIATTEASLDLYRFIME